MAIFRQVYKTFQEVTALSCSLHGITQLLPDGFYEGLYGGFYWNLLTIFKFV